MYRWVQVCWGVVPAWIIDFCDLDAWPKSCITTLHWLFSSCSVCRHDQFFKMSPNSKNKIKSRYKCLNCNKRTKDGSSRIFLSTVSSKISKKIRDLVLAGRSVQEDDVICNKCRQSITNRMKKGGYAFIIGVPIPLFCPSKVRVAVMRVYHM